jgi:polyisoprenoid-binding protein YceI
MFVLTSHKGNKVVGNLTMRGVTKSVTFAMDMGGVIEDNNGNKRSGFVLEGKINRKDFGLVWNKLMEAGGTVVGDEVRIIIEIQGVED